MNATDQIDTKPPEHWGQLLALLSMDVTAPLCPMLDFHPAMGWKDMRGRAREAILAFRERAGTAETPPDIRDFLFREDAMDWPPEQYEELATLGIEHFTPDHGDDPHLSAWQIALISFPEPFSRTVEAFAAEGEEGLADAMTAERDRHRTALVSPEELSAWDLQLCARHGWNPQSDGGFPPLDNLGIVVSLAATRRVLQRVASTVSPAAQRILYDEAAALIEEYGVWMPEPLSPLMLEVSNVQH